MDFYTSALQHKNDILIRGYKDGKRVQERIPYKPYLFIGTKAESNYRTVYGKPASRVDFDSIREAKDFLKEYKEVSGMEIYGLPYFNYVYLYDTFKGEIKYDTSVISCLGLDIEVSIADGRGFPDISLADNPVTLITISKNRYRYVFGCGEYTPHEENITYIKCENERELLIKFVDWWNILDPDSVTGWNIEFFDIPYLVNRIMKVLGESYAKKLSPWGYLQQGEIEIMGKTNQVYVPLGITILDYMQLYKKFGFTPQEQYSLEHICQEELGEGKINYGQYGSLADLETKNFQKYTEYNIRDDELVFKLEDKRKLIELVYSMAYDAKVNYQDTFTTVRLWDVLIHNYLMDRNMVVPQFSRSENNRQIVGGYVKDPQVGRHKWVVSFDLTSLYPHIFMQYNISPETMVGRFPGAYSVDDLLNGYMLNHKNYLYGSNFSATANMLLFTRDRQGFLPAIMESLYVGRKVYKNRMLDSKRLLETLEKGTPEYIEAEKDIARFDSLQQAKKIQLNGGYGALANAFNRWFDNDIAEAITMSGQLTTRWIEMKLNDYFNSILKTDGIDYVIACDTDSVYLVLDRLVDQACPDKIKGDKLEISRWLDKVCKQKIQKFINKSFIELAEYMNAYEQKMDMKREAIADIGIWTAKKRYILNVYNLEGVEFAKPKLKMTGIEAIRTSTPAVVRKAIKDALEVIMNGEEKDLQKFVEDFKDEFLKMDFVQIASPRGVNDLDLYADPVNIWKKSTPIAVKGALVFNHLIDKKNLTKRYEKITNGSKAKYCYLKTPNPSKSTVITGTGPLPPEFGLDQYLDKELQFEKTFLSPLKTITSSFGWNCERISTIEDFFL